MPQAVPRYAIQATFLDLGEIHAPVEVARVRMGGLVLAWKHSHRLVPRDEALDEPLRFFIQPDILHAARFRVRKGQDAALQVHVFPSQAELLHLAHTGQDRQPDPARVWYPDLLAKHRFFFR